MAGSGSITAGANSMSIVQTGPRAVIDWGGFSIGAGNAVVIANGQGATLNRVTGAQQSVIAGRLSASGTVYLINPAGVVIGAGGQVVTGGSFIASSRDVADAAFMGGDALSFAGSGPGRVVNRGQISAGGDVALIGAAVSNEGAISAPQGVVAMASGDQVLAYMLVNNASNLAAINSNLAGSYALSKSFAASGTMAPIGGTFSGFFDGQGQTISGLTISGSGNVGLFATIGPGAAVGALTLSGVSVNNSGAGNTGALAGLNQGSIQGVNVTGSVSGQSNVGGLVGFNDGTITQSSVIGSVTLTGQPLSAGGLVGTQATGSVSQSFANVAVGWSGVDAGLGQINMGGLVGVMAGGTVSDSYALGPVRVSTSNVGAGVELGGIAGFATGGTLSSVLGVGIVADSATDTAVKRGGVVGNWTGTVETNAYWDTGTTGQTADGAGGSGTGLSAASLSAALPGGFDGAKWQLATAAIFPYLSWQFSTTPDILSGRVLSNYVSGTAAAGITVGAARNGSALHSTLGGVSSFADGSYEFLMAAGTLDATKNIVVTADGGQSMYGSQTQYSTNSVSGLTVAANNVILNSAATSATTASALYGEYVKGIGLTVPSMIGSYDANGITYYQMQNGATILVFASAGASLTMDLHLSATQPMTLGLVNPYQITQTAPIAVNMLLLEGGYQTLVGGQPTAGGSVVLTNAGNAIAGVTGSVAALALSTTGSIVTASADGAVGLSAIGSLAISAQHNITVVSGSPLTVTGNNATATLYGDTGASQSGDVLLPGGVNIQNGTLTVYYYPTAFPNPNGFSANVIGHVQGYVLIDKPSDLQLVNAAPAGDYAVNANLDLAGFNFVPIASFSGIIDGLGHTIANFSLTDASSGDIGMIRDNYGIIRNLTLANVAVTVTAVTQESGVPTWGVAPLVGVNDSSGVIANVTVTGSLSSPASATGGRGYGGIAGDNDGSITNSLSAVNFNLAGGGYAGGISGGNFGTISQTGATGTMLVPALNTTGGAVASNFGTITQSYASGTIISGGGSAGGSNMGGLVAVNYGIISQSFAAGSINGTGNGGGNTNGNNGSLNGQSVGGLVGWNYGGSVTDSYALGTVSGGASSGVSLNYVGGAIGLNYATATNVYAAGAVSGSAAAAIGALAGGNSGTINNARFDPALAGVGNAVGQGSGAGISSFSVSSSSGTAPFGGFSTSVWTFPATARALPYLSWQTALFPQVAAASPGSGSGGGSSGGSGAGGGTGNSSTLGQTIANELVQAGLATRNKTTGAVKINTLNLMDFDPSGAVLVDLAQIVNFLGGPQFLNPKNMSWTVVTYNAVGLTGAPLELSAAAANNGITSQTEAQAAQSLASSGTSLADLAGQGGLTQSGVAPGSIVFATGVSSAGASLADLLGAFAPPPGSVIPGSNVFAGFPSSAGVTTGQTSTVTAPGANTKIGKSSGAGSGSTQQTGPYDPNMNDGTSGPYNPTTPAPAPPASTPNIYGDSGITADTIAQSDLMFGDNSGSGATSAGQSAGAAIAQLVAALGAPAAPAQATPTSGYNDPNGGMNAFAGPQDYVPLANYAGTPVTYPNGSPSSGSGSKSGSTSTPPTLPTPGLGNSGGSSGAGTADGSGPTGTATTKSPKGKTKPAPKLAAKPLPTVIAGKDATRFAPEKNRPAVIAGVVAKVQPVGGTGRPFVVGLTPYHATPPAAPTTKGNAR